MESLTSIGRAHKEGSGAEQDWVQAAEWFSKAAAKGDAAAMVLLTELYTSGEFGLERSRKLAKQWDKAARDRFGEMVIGTEDW